MSSNNNYCKNCNQELGKRRFQVWKTTNGWAYVCSRKCLDEIGAGEYNSPKPHKKSKTIKWEDE